MKRLLLLALGAVAVAVAGCNSSGLTCDEAGECTDPPAYVVVLNQGNFTEANGTLGRYDRVSGRRDSTTSLGALLQSVIAGPDGRLYVTANTADRVDVFEDGTTLRRVGQIAVPSPRYIAFSGSKAYVTSQFYDRPSVVTIVDLDTRTVTGSVEVGGFAEGIAVSGTRAYVATGAFSVSQDVVVLDTRTDAVVDRIDVGCAPRLVLSDAFGGTPSNVYVVCSGTAADEVVVLSGVTGQVAGRIAVGGMVSTAGPGQDAAIGFTGDGYALFVARADGAVVRIPLQPGAAPTAIPVGGTPLGAVAYDAVFGRLYVAHVPGFDRGGYVTVHDLSGRETARFASGGVAPSDILIEPPFIIDRRGD